MYRERDPNYDRAAGPLALKRGTAHRAAWSVKRERLRSHAAGFFTALSSAGFAGSAFIAGQRNRFNAEIAEIAEAIEYVVAGAKRARNRVR
jgi:ATP-dependent Zn protease